MPGNNIIQKQIVQVDMSLPGISPFAAQTQTAKWCNEVLVPAISRKLEKYSLVEDVTRLDRISIDFVDKVDSLSDQLAERIAAEIDAIIQTKVESANIHSDTLVVTQARTAIEVLIFFLQNAYFPWWSQLRSIVELEEMVTVDLAEEDRILLKQLLADPVIRKRFVTALSPTTLTAIFSVLSDYKKQEIENWLEKIRLISGIVDDKDLQIQFVIWSAQEFIRALLNRANETSILKTLIRRLMQHYKISEETVHLYFQQHHIIREEETRKLLLTLKHEFESPIAMETNQGAVEEIVPGEFVKAASERLKNQQQSLQKKEGIYITNAGIVLLAPFLPRFFENLGIIENGRFNSKDLALAMLQWLATGNDAYEEPELVLPKILCGMEPEEAVIIIPSLPSSFKDEGDSLLQSVIGHWNILKNTSVNGLRESFLQREGKLSKYPDEWCLQVEQKPYDMLLEHLPWNISMIRLSWMQCLLKTEWVA